MVLPHFSGHQKEFITIEIIAGLALAGNLLVCVLFARKRSLLKKSYNVYFLVLAIVDIFIAVTMAITYVLVLNDVSGFSRFSFGNQRVGEFLCRALWSRWLLYSLGVLSVYICVLLTIERWYAVAKPLNYQGHSSKKRVIISLICAALFSFTFTCSRPLDVSYSQQGERPPRCTWNTEYVVSRSVWGIFQYLGQTFIPSTIMIGLFFHIIRKSHTSVTPMYDFSERRHSNMMTSRASRNTQRTVTKMIAIASLIMILCWTPNQFFCLLSKFGVFTLDSTVHHYLEALTFFHSCLNPVIYGVTSQTFRKGYWEVFLGLCPTGMRVRLAQSRGGLGQSLGSVVFLVHTLHRRRSYDWRFEGAIRRSVTVVSSNQANKTESSAIVLSSPVTSLADYK